MAYIGAAPDGQGSAERFIFTATGSTTDTVTHNDDGLAINYEANHVSVYLNGVKQVVGTDVTASNGSTLVFASNLAEDDVIECIALSSYSPADTVPASGGTFTGAVTASAGLVANTADINGGTFDGIVGGTTPAAGSFTTIGASGAITGNLTGNASGTAATVTGGTQAAITSTANLVTVGALDTGSITSGFTSIDVGAGAIATTGALTGGTIDATTDFTIGGLVITDATITDNGTLTITATTGITLGQDTALSAGKDLETSTTGKIKQKGAFMQSSTHQALVLGY